MPFFMSQQPAAKPFIPNKYGLPPVKQVDPKAKQQIKYESLALFAKRNHQDMPLRDMAAMLYEADEKRKGNL